MFSMRIDKRENLEKDSDIVLTQIRSIDNVRLIQKIAHLHQDEILKVKKLFDEIVE
jgi:mRNA interferase MazF